MTARSRRVLRLALVLAVAPAAWACGGRDDTDVQTQPATEIATDAVRVSEIDLGTAVGPDNRITEGNETDTFRPSDMIHVSVSTDGAGSGTVLTARWTYQDGQVVDETSQTISPTGPATTQFHIMKPDGFPTGSYQVEILLDGRSVERKAFVVQ